MAERAFSLESRMTSATMLSRDLEGDAVLLNLESGTYFGLDKVGIRIWSLLREDGSLRRTCDTMQQEYDVSTETLARDILRLVGGTRSQGFG
jgi:coenzyme PQQ synthesis protein D (PqqD)